MKNLVHCFSRQTISTFLDSLAEPKSRNFEFIAALFMQRLYEKQWNVPAMIGFYMKPKWHELLLKTDNPSPDLLMDALKNGIDEHRPTDFVIAAYDETAYQEFQLKRFGMKESNTEALIDYLNALKKRYVPNDGACLIAITDFSLIDFPKVNRQVEKKNFPFAELLFMGVVADKLLVAGILPNEGFSAFDLSVVVAD